MRRKVEEEERDRERGKWRMEGEGGRKEGKIEGREEKKTGIMYSYLEWRKNKTFATLKSNQ